MTFTDILKKSFIEQFNTGVDWRDLLIAVVISFFIGIFVLAIYKLTFKGVVFNDAYALTLVLIAMITTLMIKTITSNITLSLGMVGALSIVRFRTAVKEASDTAFMFWAIAIGITTGAGFYQVAIIGSIFIGLLFFVLTSFKFGTTAKYLLVINYHTENNSDVSDYIKTLKGAKIKSKTLTKAVSEITVELRLSLKDHEAVLDKALALTGVESVNLVSYNGDYAS